MLARSESTRMRSEAAQLERRGTSDVVGVEEAAREAIDDALETWRQGDCVVGEQWFLSRVDPEKPLTIEAIEAAEAEADAAEAEVRGLMLATQSCDAVRDCADRPFVEVCPLVEVEAGRLEEIRRGRRPNYAYVPGLAAQRLVADLDRAMTVEKAVVASWTRVRGCSDDGEVRRLAHALARKRVRAAFPNDFVILASKLSNRLSEKHDKGSDEGRALRALREIRVRAAPAWEAEKVGLEGVRFFVYEADGVRRRNVLFGGGARLWRDV